MEAPFRTPPTRDRVPITEHISFLRDAAHLLRATAPETSAWLMCRGNELLLDEGIQQTDAQRQRVCGACGHIMIIGMGSSIEFDAERTSRKRQRHVEGRDAKLKIEGTGVRKGLQCGHCSQKTTIKLDPPPSANKIRKQLKQQKSQTTKEPRASEVTMKRASSAASSSKPSSATSTPTNSSANASSKKRAKNRKAGLQALLEQSKNAKGSRSLSLADFSMKR
ncbi:hypothetical protein ACHAQH_006199 [Verticillium albo-atrum]